MSKKSVWDVVFNVGGQADPSLKRTMRQTRQQINDIQRAGRQVGKDFKAFTGSIARLGAMATGIAVGAGAAIYGLASNIANNALNIEKTSTALGLHTDEWQKLEFAMGRQNVEGNKLQYALRTYQRLITKAASGNENARSTFEDLGLSWEKMSQLSPAEALLAVGDGIANVTDQAQGMEMAYQLFGTNAGHVIAGAFRDGGDEIIREGMRIAQESGMLIDEYAIASAGAFRNARDELGATFQGLKNQFGVGLFEPLTQAFQTLAPHIKEMQPMFKEFGQQVAEWIMKLVDNLPYIIERVKEFGQNTWERIEQLRDFVGGWENLAKVIGLLVISPVLISGLRLIYSVGNLIFVVFKNIMPIAQGLGLAKGGGAAAGAAKGGFMGIGFKALLPLLGKALPIIAAIAAVVYIVKQNWDRIEPIIRNAMERIMEAVRPIIEAMQAWWEEHGETVILWFNKIADFIGEYVVTAVEFFVDKIATGIETIITIATGLWDYWSNMWDAMRSIVSAFISMFQGDFSGAISHIQSAIGSIGAAFQSAFATAKSIVEGFIGFFTRAIDRLSGAASRIAGIFGGGGGGGGGGGLPQHAKGGIFYHRHVAEIAERGAEAVIPLKNDPNAYSLWQQAGRLAGFNDTRVATSGASVAPKVSKGSSAPANITISPTFTVNVANGDGAKQKIEQAAQRVMDDFKREMDNYTRQQQRVSYG